MTTTTSRTDPIPELTLAGPPRQRGLAHGEQLRSLIAETIDRWRDALAARTEPEPFLSRLVADTGFLDAARQYSPDLVDEVGAMAEAANQTFETMFAWQLIDESWWYLDQVTDSLNPHEACSAMAISHNGRGFVAQTQDLYRHFDGSQIMLRYQDADGLEILAPSAAGLLAYNGVNSAGLAVCITTLSQLAHRVDGLSSGFVMPSLIRCRTIDEALAFLSATPMASGNSWILGTGHRSLVVEASAVGVTTVEDGDRAFHTNHALAQEPAWDYVRFEGSVDRLEQLQATISSDSNLDTILEMYRTGPICRPDSSPEPVISVATMIFEIGGSQRCHLAPGPLDSTPLAVYDMQA